ncbi:MAG TPA: Gfo/Idh/MocA family oxidoreductase [Thermoanaerobaculia bacterium]|nr:Gfo/Idh/MocA family oxidoreductase [Thermoanaerobaculia bacterium]
MKVGVFGTGYLGRLHARVLTEMPEARVVGFVEPNATIAAQIESDLKITRFDDARKLASEIDCAVIATPTTSHFEVAKDLLNAGVDVLIEKPITATTDEARELIELAAQKNRVVQVGHVERYNPAITAVADLVRNARYFESERLGVFVPRSLDVDVLLDLMVHDLNLVLSLLKQKVVEIRAVGVPVLTEKVDITNVRLELENGAVANLTASRVSQERVRKQRFFGGDFYISVDTKEQEVKGYRLIEDDTSNVLRPFELQVTKKEPLRAELEAFLQCVRDRSRPIVAAEDGLEAVDLALRVGQAIDAAVKKFKGITPR